jgi:23S rRNA (pseudouridine1915-N3)-methyltransferase
VRVIVAIVGRDRAGPARDLFEDYRRRCPWPIELVSVAPRRISPAARRLAEEGERLLKALPGGATLVALGEGGRELDSRAFARHIDRWQSQGTGVLAFAIGGPDGLAPAVLDRAELVLALGRMTWPHELARVMLAEQLYRAGALLAGHPYHRE